MTSFDGFLCYLKEPPADSRRQKKISDIHTQLAIILCENYFYSYFNKRLDSRFLEIILKNSNDEIRNFLGKRKFILFDHLRVKTVFSSIEGD